MTAAELKDRADRVKAIVERNFGRILSRDGDVMRIETPADLAPGLAGTFGLGGFVPIFMGQSIRQAPRRVTDMQGNTIVCDNDMLTTAFYRYDIDLRPRDTAKPAPTAADITRPTRPRV